MFLQFAFEVGAIDGAEQKKLEQRSSRALEELEVLQAKYHPASDPALRFVALLQAALKCGRAHVADRQGRAPDQAERLGWQRTPTGRAWVGLGTRIGWVTRNEVFLEPEASYQVAQSLAGTERLPVSEQTPTSIERTRAIGQHRRRPPGAAGAPHSGGVSETSAPS